MVITPKIYYYTNLLAKSIGYLLLQNIVLETTPLEVLEREGSFSPANLNLRKALGMKPFSGIWISKTTQFYAIRFVFCFILFLQLRADVLTARPMNSLCYNPVKLSLQI